MKIDPPWLHDAATRRVVEALTENGQGPYFVGGCVRDVVLGVAGGDVDITTASHPEDVIRLAQSAGLKAIPTGLAHGTITVVSNGLPYEVTTFRRDVTTDGRRAVVAYTDSLEEDAKRRDFTMNALYATPDGDVIDPLGGLGDTKARRVRFIGEPEDRIREDYLRILRFFRFHAHYGDPGQGIDAASLAGCAALHDGLSRVSVERIGVEIRKLLMAVDPAPAVAAMATSGVLSHVLPGADASMLPPLIDAEQSENIAPRWQRRLAAITRDDVADRLRLSRQERRELDTLSQSLSDTLPLASLAAEYGADAARDVALARKAGGLSLPASWKGAITLGEHAEFPVSAADLTDNIPPGPELGHTLKSLRRTWLEAELNMDREALLKTLGTLPGT